MRLSQVNWSNYDLVVIDESHNFRNDDAFKDRETRYQRLMNRIVRQGVRTKVLMLSATPVNNRFNDLKNQLALAYEGEPENLKSPLINHLNDLHGIQGNPKPSPGRRRNFVVREAVREILTRLLTR
jgi:SNF2 family DNA or RNA helicase